MSFDFSPIGNLSNVQKSSKPTDGGGGNTGYFQRGNEEEEANLAFKKDYPQDSFEKVDLNDIEENPQTEEAGFFSKLIAFFKKFFKKIFNKKPFC